MLDSRLENSCVLQSQPAGAIESTDVSGNNFMFGSKCVMGDREVTTEISCSSDQAMKSDQTVPPASNFVFNLPYLKTRLNQINSSDRAT